MSSVGQILKEAREARGLTLHDMQEKTKIQPRYLKAIEEDRFEVLPGHFYTRAFVRTYAEYVGIDPQPLLSQLKDPEDDNKLESVQEFQKIGRRADREREPSFSLATWFSRGLLILFLALVVFVIYTAVQGANLGTDMFSGKSDDQRPKSATGKVGKDGDDSKKDDKDAEKQKEENIEPVVTVKKTREEGASIYYDVSGTKEIKMKVKSNERVWFEVRERDSSGQVLASKVIEQGDTEEFTSEDGLYIRLGNTHGVDLTVNDTKVSTDFKQPKNFIFELKTGDTDD